MRFSPILWTILLSVCSSVCVLIARLKPLFATLHSSLHSKSFIFILIDPPPRQGMSKMSRGIRLLRFMADTQRSNFAVAVKFRIMTFGHEMVRTSDSRWMLHFHSYAREISVVRAAFSSGHVNLPADPGRCVWRSTTSILVRSVIFWQYREARSPTPREVVMASPTSAETVYRPSTNTKRVALRR